MKGRLFLLLLINSCLANYFLLDYEHQKISKDSNGQVDLYGPHTVVESWLYEHGEVFGYFMSSQIKVQSIEHSIARGVCSPYTIVDWRGTASVLSAPCPGEIYAKQIIGEKEYELPFADIDLIKYDFSYRQIYVLYKGTLKSYDDSTFKLRREIKMGNTTDFYVANGKIFYLQGDSFFCYDQPDNHFLENTQKITTYYLPNSATFDQLNTILLMVFIMIIL